MQKLLILIACLLIYIQFSLITFAGGPLTTYQSRSIVYKTMPITYRTDKGNLGAFSNLTAKNLTIESFQVWQDVASSNVAFTNQGELPVDVDGTNFTNYLDNFSDGINPVVFDNNGAIIDAIFGIGASDDILGYAGSAYYDAGPDAGYYAEGEAVLNGKFSQPPYSLTEIQYKATIVHELGHFIGLDHTQINDDFAGDGNPANDIYIPTMYPTATDDDVSLASLNPDDIAAVSFLYPEPSFAASTGKISGTAVRFDNSVVRGANVVAISTTDSLMNQISTVTDYFVQNTGAYTIHGLSAGNYFIKIEPVIPSFTGGSSVGPYAEDGSGISFINPVLAEYYNGQNESHDPLIDSVNARVSVSVNVGLTTSGINILANKVPDQPLTNILEYHGTPTYIIELPSEFEDIAYAVRFTPGADAKLKRTEFLINGGTNGIKGNGTLKVTVHNDTTGSLGGIPGTQIGSAINIPFSSLTKGVFNTVDLSPLNITIPKDVNFHVVFQVIGVAGDTLQFIADGGANPTNRSSSLFDAGSGLQWYNFLDAKNFGSGENLVIRTVVDLLTSAREEETLLQDNYALMQNYPNPFNPVTRINYALPDAGYVTFKVYDVLGREVATLVNEFKEAGYYSVDFDASSTSGGLSSGIYFYKLNAGSYTSVKKMILAR
ncbi:MAG: T9SS type A sorting domain-containing protein [Bacteroidota bacterium]|nr:T9SS type A sorting domain-containing protein [Bacteroidota bacterium]